MTANFVFALTAATMSLILNISYFNTNKVPDDKIKMYLYDGSLAGVLFMLISSGIVQLITLVLMKEVLTKDRLRSNVSFGMLAWQLIGFVIFILSEIIFIAIIFVWTSPWKPSLKAETIYISAYFGSQVGTFISQLFVSVILVKLARRQDRKYSIALTSEYFPTLVVEEYD